MNECKNKTIYLKLKELKDIIKTFEKKDQTTHKQIRHELKFNNGLSLVILR